MDRFIRKYNHRSTQIKFLKEVAKDGYSLWAIVYEAVLDEKTVLKQQENERVTDAAD